MRVLFLVLLSLMLASPSMAALQTRSLEYKQGDTVLEGYLSYDDRFTGKRPGILVAHEWMGLNDYAKLRANMLARLGYVAFAVDIYGKGVRPKTTEEAGALASKYKGDRKLLQARILAALSLLKAEALVDPSRTAAIGYCFGGTAVLELARSGAELNGIVSFHGGLSNPSPENAKNIKTQVLVLHGADDPFVPPAEVASFEQEMKAAGRDYTLIKYPGAVHAFTNPSNRGEIKGALYNREADKKSWEEMEAFLSRVLK
ncbi:MAG: dienelactone hydrolase family protein [Candidatus Omnitrophota bacterium]